MWWAIAAVTGYMSVGIWFGCQVAVHIQASEKWKHNPPSIKAAQATIAVMLWLPIWTWHLLLALIEIERDNDRP